MTSLAGNGDRLVHRLLSDRARATPGAWALESSGGERLTYDALHKHALALAADLRQMGLGPGDRVATVTENDVAHVVLFFACASAGFVLVPLNWRLAPPEIAAQLDIAAPALVAASAGQWRKADEARSLCALAPVVVPLGELYDRAQAENGRHRPGTGPEQPGRSGGRAQPDDDDGLLMVFTSGTTGRPKGAVLSHANCFWTNLSLDCVLPLGGHDVVVQVLPQCHVGGWNVQPLQAWWKGARVLLEKEFDPERLLWLVEDRRVTTMMGVPTTYQRMAEVPRFGRADLSSLRTVVVGGAAMPPGLLGTWQRRGVAVAQGYGLTEAAPNVLYLGPQDAAGHPGSVGHPYPFVDVELHEPVSGELLVGGGPGEVWVSGPNVFSGYWQDPAATAQVMAGRWLRTGDMAERDEDGFHRICGRIKEIYISGGENVYPAEVEDVLCTHPGVADAAVVGVPDERWGETGVAFVQARGGHGVGADELVAYCRARLAGFKAPRRVVVLEHLPRLATGKLDKRRLVAMATGTEEEATR